MASSQTVRRRRSRLATATWVLAGFLLSVVLLEWFVAERFWWTTLSTYAPQQWAFLLPMTLLLIAMVRRRGRLIIAAWSGFGNTFSSTCPTVWIDYIFTSPTIRIRSCEVLDVPGSDHRPVLAGFFVHR